MSVKIEKNQSNKNESIYRTPDKKLLSNGTNMITPFDMNKHVIPSTIVNSSPKKVSADNCKSIFEDLDLLKLGSQNKNIEKNSTKHTFKMKPTSSSLLKNLKLQTAFIESKYFNENYGKSVKLQKTIYGKGIQKMNDFNSKMAKTKKELRRKEMEGVQSKPLLSPNTKNIIKNKFADMKPLYLRIDEVIENKRKEREYLSVKYEEPQNEINVGKYEKEKFDSWIEEKYNWNNNKNIKILERRIKQENDEISIIKKLSSQAQNEILNKTSDNINIEPIYLRYNFHTKCEKHHENTTFTPFKSRKCPNFSVGAKDKKDLNLSINTHREHDMIHFNTFRNVKSVKGKKGDLFFTNKTSWKTKATSNRKFSLGDEESRNSHWQDSIHNININRKNFSNEDIDALYKLNVRNNLAWDCYKENNIYYTTKYRNLVKNLFE